MLDYIYHVTFNILKIAFWREKVKKLLSFLRNVIMDVIMTKSIKHVEDIQIPKKKKNLLFNYLQF